VQAAGGRVQAADSRPLLPEPKTPKTPAFPGLLLNPMIGGLTMSLSCASLITNALRQRKVEL
jgi:hypothetical protein